MIPLQTTEVNMRRTLHERMIPRWGVALVFGSIIYGRLSSSIVALPVSQVNSRMFFIFGAKVYVLVRVA